MTHTQADFLFRLAHASARMAALAARSDNLSNTIRTMVPDWNATPVPSEAYQVIHKAQRVFHAAEITMEDCDQEARDYLFAIVTKNATDIQAYENTHIPGLLETAAATERNA